MLEAMEVARFEAVEGIYAESRVEGRREAKWSLT